MKLSYKDIIDKHKSKTGLCVATGPSYKLYIDLIGKLSNSKDKFCTLSVNDFDEMFYLNADYRVVANSIFTVKREYERLNRNPSTVLCYSDTVDTTNKNLVENVLNVNYFTYDQRHFGNKTCLELYNEDRSNGCCRHIDSRRVTIQEKLKEYTGYKALYSSGSTVSLHMLSLSILSGCKNIYIFGVDLDYSKGYANSNFFNNDSFNPYLREIIEDFSTINKSAQNIGVNIFSCCENSPINSVIRYKEINEFNI